MFDIYNGDRRNKKSKIIIILLFLFFVSFLIYTIFYRNRNVILPQISDNFYLSLEVKSHGFYKKSPKEVKFELEKILEEFEIFDKYKNENIKIKITKLKSKINDIIIELEK